MNNYKDDEILLMEIGKKLQKIRNSKGLSQEDVYIDTDLNMSRIEGGKTDIRLSTLLKLCKYYNISLEEFFRGIDME